MRRGYDYADYLEFAHLSDQSYKKAHERMLPSGWEVIAEHAATSGKLTTAAASKMGKTTAADEDVPIAERHFVAYFNYSENRLVIAYRGTDFNNTNDVMNDVQIFKDGQPEERVREALEFTRRVVEKVSTWNFWYQHRLFASCHLRRPKVQLTGHSLGAAVAECVCLRTGYETVTFDSPGLELTALDNTAYCDRITSLLNYPDLVNCCNSHPGNTYHIPAQGEFSEMKQVAKVGTKALFRTGANAAAGYFGLPPIVGTVASKVTTKIADPLKDTWLKHPLKHFIKALHANAPIQQVSEWPSLTDYLTSSEPNRLISDAQQSAVAKTS